MSDFYVRVAFDFGNLMQGRQRTYAVILNHLMFTQLIFNGKYCQKVVYYSQWFPSRTGLVTGIVVAGFGLGPLVFTPIQTELINPDNLQVDNRTRQMTDNVVLDRVPNTFLLLGALLFALQFIGMFLLRSKSYKRSGGKRIPETNAVSTGLPFALVGDVLQHNSCHNHYIGLQVLWKYCEWCDHDACKRQGCILLPIYRMWMCLSTW
ncbi:uncharacterized protein DEA37_0012364 [Paragonimus westermani]|uniref:Uncharacterized protein n=1 Tax=Paragonimus westermani TaxID=34504 RepID=A0A5J4N6V3_9TREM|nr:uncharacterized protein DEA37_0012364 [Paragonimus westermani]